jgi:monooxygenase
LSEVLIYRGIMYSGVPNMAVASGYTNASWTLKCELAARYVCRVLDHMKAGRFDTCKPVPASGVAASGEMLLNLTSGYVQRAASSLPRQGTRKPWRMYQNYLRDLLSLRFSRLRDGALRFSRSGTPST